MFHVKLGENNNKTISITIAFQLVYNTKFNEKFGIEIATE